MKKSFVFVLATLFLVIFTFSNHQAIAGKLKPLKTTTATACNSYTWSANGVTYTASGVYTYTNTATNTPYKLNLTINYSTNTTLAVSQCGSYTWPANGMTYTASGTYTNYSGNPGGCVNTETLNLTINYNTSTILAYSQCGGSFTWPTNGMTYTASGTYTYTSINATGCLNTEELDLVIDQPVNNTSNVTMCNSYTWPVNGQTYNTSGTYIEYVGNGNGCMNTETLNLTILSCKLQGNTFTLGDALEEEKIEVWTLSGQCFSKGKGTIALPENTPIFILKGGKIIFRR